MQNNNEAVVIRLLQMSEDQQKIVIRKFSKLSFEQKMQVFSNHGKNFYALKQKKVELENAVLSYIALIQAISTYVHSETEIIKISKIKNGYKRSQSKSDKLIERWSLIKELKNDHKLSFREIAAYLMKYHKIKIAHSTIYDTWKKLEKKDEKNG